MSGESSTTTSPTGTTSTGLDYSAKDICDIIRACDKSGVKELKLGELCVSFNVDPNQNATLEHGVVQNLEAHTHSDQRALREDAPLQSMVTDDQKTFLQMAEAENNLIEDPIAHEQAVIDTFRSIPPTPEQLEELNA